MLQRELQRRAWQKRHQALGWDGGEVLGGKAWKARKTMRLQGDGHVGLLGDPCRALGEDGFGSLSAEGW